MNLAFQSFIYLHVKCLEIPFELQAGFFSALPYLIMALMVQIGGQIADFLRSKRVLSTSVVRKLFTCFGKYVQQFICSWCSKCSDFYQSFISLKRERERIGYDWSETRGVLWEGRGEYVFSLHTPHNTAHPLLHSHVISSQIHLATKHRIIMMEVDYTLWTLISRQKSRNPNFILVEIELFSR